MNKSCLALLCFIALAGTLSAQEVITPWASKINGTAISISIPSQSSTALPYGGSSTFTFNGLLLTFSNTLPSFTSIPISGFSMTVSAPQSNFPSHQIIVAAAGEGNLTVNNVTIVTPPKCAITNTIAPSWTNTTTIENTSGSCAVSITIAPIQKLNMTGTYNASLNDSIVVSNSITGISYTVKPLPMFNRTVQVGIGGEFQLHGLTVLGPTYNSIFTDNALIPLYNSEVNSTNCANIDTIVPTTPNSLPIRICIQPSNESAPSIFSACESYNLKMNLTPTGLYGCLFNTLSTANESARYWHNQAVGANGTGGYYGMYLTAAHNASVGWADASSNSQNAEALDWAMTAVIVVLMIGIGLMQWNLERIRRAPPFGGQPGDFGGG